MYAVSGRVASTAAKFNNTTVIECGREIERRYRLSWWDSLVVAAAQLQGCTLLLSEDMQDRMVLGGVTVRNPFTLRANEAATANAAGPSARSPHRSRGRPRSTDNGA